jgi:Family of unknown function (DUF5706)
LIGRKRVDDSAIENAWRIHNAQVDWTGKVDAKAAFAFGVHSAVIAGVVVLVSTGRVFHPVVHGYTLAVFILGLVFMMAAVILSALVVAPRLRSKKVKPEADSNFIYFGHVRYWKPVDLERALRAEDLLPQLSRQIVSMAKIAWVKHRRVQWSIWVGFVGGLVLVVDAFLSRIPS